MKYENYIFDLYGTLVDIHTDEEKTELWEKLAQFYGYYGAVYTAEELKNAYACLTGQKEDALRQEMGPDAAMKKDDAHEAHPEIEIEEVFLALFQKKGVQADIELAIHAGQFFRILSTEYIRLYDGAKELLAASVSYTHLKHTGETEYFYRSVVCMITGKSPHVILGQEMLKPRDGSGKDEGELTGGKRLIERLKKRHGHVAEMCIRDRPHTMLYNNHRIPCCYCLLYLLHLVQPLLYFQLPSQPYRLLLYIHPLPLCL